MKALEEKSAKEAKARVHEKLFTESKINKAQLVALNEGKDLLEVLSLSEKLNVDPQGAGGTPPETVELSDKEKQVCESLGLTKEEFLASKSEEA